MFYPVTLDLDDARRITQALAVLTLAESKRLLAKAVASLPEVTSAYATGRLAISTGSTCAFVLEELTGEKIPPYCYSVGFIADGLLTQGLKDDREVARFFVNGTRVTQEAFSFFDTFGKGDAAVKGGNAVDEKGHVGVLSSNKQSGTVGALQSLISSRGLPLIMPVGLEKLVPCVTDAAAGWGQLSLSRSTGLACCLFPVITGLVVTEIQALGLLAGVRGRLVAGGGIGESEGSWQVIESVKGEPRVTAPRHHLCPA